MYVIVGVLCLMRCFLSDEECLELASLRNHGKLREKNAYRVATVTFKKMKFCPLLSGHTVLDSTMT